MCIVLSKLVSLCCQTHYQNIYCSGSFLWRLIVQLYLMLQHDDEHVERQEIEPF